MQSKLGYNNLEIFYYLKQVACIIIADNEGF